jgi:hypothetical protein
MWHGLVLFLLALASGCASKAQWIAVAPDSRHFIQQSSNKPFAAWGFNYDRDYKMRLIEDYWVSEWATIEGDFREMKQLGANVVRVHLQVAKFMDAADQPNQANLARLNCLVRYAESVGLYVDITGLGSYHKQDAPAWYAQADEAHRWQAQANFWEAIARTCADRPGVFCYDLVNEPVIPGEKVKSNDWIVPANLGGFYYVQYLALDPAGRDRMQIARDWTAKMTAAIRKHDRKHLITIGMLPLSVDLANALAPQLDFIATHFYPDAKKVDEAVANLHKFEVGKPLVVEETFPMPCSVDELAEFIERTRGFTGGYISFYWGKSLPELRASGEIGDAVLLAWLERYSKLLATAK